MNWQPFMNKGYLADNVKGCTKVRAARAVRLFSSFNQSDHCVLTFSLPSLSSSHCTGGVWIRTVSSQSLLGELDLDFTAITGLSFFFSFHQLHQRAKQKEKHRRGREGGRSTCFLSFIFFKRFVKQKCGIGHYSQLSLFSVSGRNVRRTKSKSFYQTQNSTSTGFYGKRLKKFCLLTEKVRSFSILSQCFIVKLLKNNICAIGKIL